jgi:hypothetical protein
MNTKTVTAVQVIKAAAGALSAGLKAGDALRAYVGFAECSTMADMVAYEGAYKTLLADAAYTGASKDVQAKVRRLMTDAVRGKAGYSTDKAGAISVKVAGKADAPKADAPKADAPITGNAAAIKTVGELANVFLPEADRAKFGEMLAMISSKLATATTAKK